MNKSTAKIVSAAVLAISSSSLFIAGEVAAAEMEKCYGVAQAGKNDCQTATSSCAGTSSSDRQVDAFIAVPKGTCGKIAGGSLTAG
jgi:uncharacterized membrane protein